MTFPAFLSSTHFRRRTAYALLALGALIAPSRQSAATGPLILDGTIATARALHPLIVNGRATASSPPTGALLVYAETAASSLYGLCSGTLIGCQTFLTAAHCVCPDDADNAAACERRGTVDPARLRVFLQQGGVFAVTAVRIAPYYAFADGGDVALLTLSEPVAGIAPSPINTLRRADVGTSATIVGFGTTAAGPRRSDDAGIKREGTVTVAVCSDDIPVDSHLCWQFGGSGSNTCEGDSGGPLFTDVGSGVVLAGVTSGGSSFDCLAPDVGFDSDVFVDRAWILNTAGTDIGTASCTLPAAGSRGTATFSTTGQLDETNPEAQLQLEVPEGTAVLRVALNAQLTSGSGFDQTANDFDLFLRAQDSPTSAAFDCADTNATPFGFCEIDAPRPGTWHALVSLTEGAGAFQVTATAFAGASLAAFTGDCNADRGVTVDEVLEGVGIALGNADLAICPTFDVDSDQAVTINELLAAVTAALEGCPAS